MWDAFKKIPGYRFPEEAAAGDASGIYWTPNSINPHTERRSFARTGHYDGEPERRDNFHLLPAHRVTQLLLTESSESDSWIAEGVRFTPRDGDMPDMPREVRAKREVIVAAGAAHTPQVLQRSGIGPRGVLEAAGAEVKVELPGVGENFQDHPNVAMSYRCTFRTADRQRCE
jgi:choline dehydrogenase-like flavoprotein